MHCSRLVFKNDSTNTRFVNTKAKIKTVVQDKTKTHQSTSKSRPAKGNTEMTKMKRSIRAADVVTVELNLNFTKWPIRANYTSIHFNL